MFDIMLIAIDGSTYTKHILELAKPFCTLFTEAHLIYVGDIDFTVEPNYPQDKPSDAKTSDQQTAANQLIQECLDSLKQANIKVTPRIVTGDPAEQIIAYAKQVKAKLIIMGHRQMSKISRLFDPSTCMKVIENAPCPVLIEGIKKI